MTIRPEQPTLPEKHDACQAPAIEASHLTKFYGRVLAMEDVSFTVAVGQTVGLLGTNGSGKTTTMRVLTGYMPPTSGTASVAGHDLAKESLEARRHIGYLPEAVPLYTELTVLESLRFFGRLRRMSKQHLTERIDYVLGGFGIGGYRDTIVGKLSKGYRQRLGLAIAVLHEPEVLVLDEPTVSIDPVQAIESRELIRGLGREHTVLISTHQLNEATSLCDRVIILHRGTVAAQGTPEEIAAHVRQRQHLRVEVSGDAALAITTIEGSPDVVSVSRPAPAFDGGVVVEVTVVRNQGVREDLARRIVEAGLGLRTLTSAGVDLEDVFLSLRPGGEGASLSLPTEGEA
jgi:ABC-2 type transport system ATP-binding protein